MIRRKLITITSSLILAVNLIGMTTNTYVQSENNNSEGTYKSSNEEINEITHNIKLKSKPNYNYGSNYKNIQGYTVEKSWLLEHDILTKDLNIEVTPTEVNNSVVEKVASITPLGSVTKSDFYMGLYKSIYGLEKSRPLIFQTKKSALILDKGSIKPEPCINYNYSTFITPNVYELYFTKLLDKGFISKSEFKEDSNFIKSYNSLSTSKPLWWNDKKPYILSSTSTPNNYLGDSIVLSRENNFYIRHYEPSYFKNESIKVIDAFKLVKTIMESQENYMSELESKIITYKYGVDYILKLKDDERKVVSYLVAMGIIDFENDAEFTNLDSYLTESQFIKILYRIANKASRVDFSKVQLTDNENYWLEKGFYESEVKIVNNTAPLIEDKFINQPEATNSFAEVGSYSIMTLSPDKNEDESLYTYTVERTIKNGIDNCYYKGIKITDFETLKKEFEEVKEASGDSNKVSLKFEIKAPSPNSALAIIDNGFTVKYGNDTVTGRIKGVAKVSKDDSKEVFIPKTSLEDLNSEIEVLDDLYLINCKSGARAVISSDNSFAIIGSEIYTPESTVIAFGKENETYYNLYVILKLCSDKYIDELCSNVVTDYKVVDNQEFRDVTNEFGTKGIGTVLYGTLDARVIGKLEGEDKKNKSFVSLNHCADLLNCIYKRIDINKDGHPIYMVVDWKIVLPDNTSSNTAIYNSFEILNKNNPSVSEMTNFFNKRPNDGTLSKWWDSNIGLSNALCNYLFGTTGKSYFQTGYLVPSIDFLCIDNLKPEDVDKYLSKLVLSSEYSKQFITGNNIRKSLFNISGTKIYDNLCEGRKLSIYRGFKTEYAHTYEFGKYLIGQSGSIWRSIGKEENSTLEPTTSGIKVVSEKVEGKNYLDVGTVYNVKDKDYIYLGELAPFNTTTYQLVAKDYQLVKFKEVEDGKFRWVLKDDESKELANVIKDLIGDDNKKYTYPTQEGWLIGPPPLPINKYSDFSSAYMSIYSDSDDKENRYFLAYQGIDNYSLSLTQHFGSQKYVVYKIIDDKNYTVIQPNRIEKEFGNKDIYVRWYPSIYLDSDKWSQNENGDLVENKQVPYFFRPYLHQTGLISNIIDSIVASSYNYKKFSKIPEGSEVHIGNINFIKKNGKLISEPFKDTNACNSLIGNTFDRQKVLSVLTGCFDGISLTIQSEFGKLEGSNALCNYLVSKGEEDFDIDFSYNNDYNFTEEDDYTLVKTDGELRLIKDGELSEFQNGQSISGFVFSIKLNDNVYFAPLDRSNNKFKLSSITSNNTGSIVKVPFFVGRLGFSWDSVTLTNIVDNLYVEADQSLLSKIFKEMQELREKDWFNILRLFLLFALFYLFAMTWIGYAIKNMLPFVCEILYKIKDPGPNGHGVDLLKIFTLGIHSLDKEENSLFRTIGIGFLITLLIIIQVVLTGGF